MKDNRYVTGIIRPLQVLLPFIISLIGILCLYVFIDTSKFGKVVLLMMVYMIPPLGKESLIPIGISGGNVSVPFIERQFVIPAIDPFVMAVSIAFVDIMVALFLVWNYDLVKKIPWVGDIIERIESAGKDSASRYAWVKPLEFVGIVLFVIIPFQGSGGFFASIVGRLFGMNPWNIFIAIVIGSFLSTFMIAYFADLIFSYFIGNFIFSLLIVILVFVVVFIVIYWRSQR